MESGHRYRNAKLRRPVVATDLVPRPHLIARLDPGRGVPLTLISAPAGYGKTSLAAELAAACGHPVAWVSLDEHDAPPEAFVRVVAAAIRAAVPDCAMDVASWLQVDATPDELASDVADAIDELDAPLLLVLDELEHVASEGTYALLTALLAYPPLPLRLVVTSRHDPPLDLAALRARGWLCEVRQADLALTVEETGAFVARIAGRPLDDRLTAAVHERTAGWPAAVRMLALALRGAPEAADLLEQLPRGVASVHEYLAGTVLAQQPQGVREHLLRSSIAGAVCAPLCDALSAGAGTLDGAAFLDHVRRNGLPVVDDDGTWLRLHPLLRDHLSHRLLSDTTPERVARLHDRARDWYDRSGLVTDAVDHALRGTSPATAADVLARHRDDMMNEDRDLEIADLVLRIRAEVGQDALVVRLLDAWYTAPMSELPGLLRSIESDLESEPLEPSERRAIEGEVHALRALDLSARFEFAAAADHARSALERIPAAATGARSLAYFAQITNAQAAGAADRARAIVGEADAELALAPLGARTSVRAAETFLHWNEGDVQSAVAAAERALADAGDTPPGSALLSLRAQLAIAHYLRNDLALAEEHARHAARYRQASANVALARILEALGRRTEADEVVAELARTAASQRGTDLETQTRALRAELALRRGDVATALAWADGVRDDHIGAHTTTRPVGVVLAAVLAAAGDAGNAERARQVLDRLEGEAARSHRVPNLAEVLAVRAALAAGRGDTAAAVDALSRALGLTRPGAIVRGYLDLAPGVLPLLRHAELPADVRAHARAVAEAAGRNAPAAGTFSPQVLADDLTNREQDVLELLQERLANKEIAKRLHIAPETVKRHLANVYDKLHVHGRREAVRKAAALGLLRAP